MQGQRKKQKGATIKNVATVIDDATKEPEGRKTNIVENPYVETDIVAEKVATSEYGREYVIEGEKIKYTITLTNKGDLATTVKVKDTAPDNTEFVSDSIEVLDSKQKVLIQKII